MFSKKPKSKALDLGSVPISKTVKATDVIVELPGIPEYEKPSFRDAISRIREREKFDQQYLTYYPDRYERSYFGNETERQEREVERQIETIINILNYGGEPKLANLVSELFKIVKDMTRRHSSAENRAWTAEREVKEFRGYVEALRASPTAVCLPISESTKINRAREWCSSTRADVNIVDAASQTIFMFADKTAASKFKLMFG